MSSPPAEFIKLMDNIINHVNTHMSTGHLVWPLTIKEYGILQTNAVHIQTQLYRGLDSSIQIKSFILTPASNVGPGGEIKFSWSLLMLQSTNTGRFSSSSPNMSNPPNYQSVPNASVPTPVTTKSQKSKQINDICKDIADCINKDPSLMSWSYGLTKSQDFIVVNYVNSSIKALIETYVTTGINVTNVNYSPATLGSALIEVEWTHPTQHSQSMSGGSLAAPSTAIPAIGNHPTTLNHFPQGPATFSDELDKICDYIKTNTKTEQAEYAGEFQLPKDQMDTIQGLVSDGVKYIEEMFDRRLKNTGIVVTSINITQKNLCLRWNVAKNKPEINYTPAEIYEENKTLDNCIKCGQSTVPKALLSSIVNYCGGCCD